LRRAGVQVTVYDRYDRSGGLLTYGIPSFKLEKEVVLKRVGQLEKGGVKIINNCNVGVDLSFNDIRLKHDAVIIATGVYKSRELEISGMDADGIVKAIDYLTASNRNGFGDDVPNFKNGSLNADGKKVVVLGGGDTAMDCVRTAVRQGATSVKCLYRRDKANMPGSVRETQNAQEEGVEFVWLSSPKGFVGQPVSGVSVQKMRLGSADATGRQSAEVIEGADYIEPADLVIKALGFEAENLPKLWDTEGLEVTRWGTVKADFETGQTSLPGVFAIGDIVRGASLVVWAIRDGRDCARAILTELKDLKTVAAE
jgi:glutamate synthase (NADPH/NADH) small chain